MLENINLALQGVWSHKLRSFLTMLGIIIGIAAIITIVSTIRGTNEQIKQNLIGAGNDMVQVQLTQDGSTVDFSYGELPEGIAAITSAMRDEMDALPGVSAVAMYRQRTWADGIYAGNQSFTGTLNGVDDHYLSVAGYQVNYGRAFLPEDFSSRRKVAVIDTTAAQSLFPGQNPIGGVIEMQGEPFTVVGVVSQRVTSQPVINSVEDYQMYARTTSGTVMIPESCWPIAFRYDEPMNVAVRASSTNDMTKAGSGVADYLNSQVVTNRQLTYQAQDLLKQASELQSLSETTNRQLIWIAAISLVVGGIGVMNIMLVSVTERTREIGTRKALGAKNSAIRVQFIVESMIICLIGGVIGGKVSSKAQLTAVSVVALVFVLLGIFAPIDTMGRMPVFTGTGFAMIEVPIGVMFLTLCGLCTSVMWGGIFNLAVEGLGKYTSMGSGFFMVMVCGGGILPLIQGGVADFAGYLSSYWVVIVGLAYILFYALVGSKNVNKDIPVTD